MRTVTRISPMMKHTFEPAPSSATTKAGLLILLTVVLFSGACRKPAAALDVATHKKEIEKWQSDRLAGLKKEDGWLTLVGLFWLNEGENKFGSDPSNVVVLPKDKAPGLAGSLTLEQGRVRLKTTPGVEIT